MIAKLRNEIDVMERHLYVLKMIVEKGPIGIIKLSDLTRFAPHKVRYSLRILENHNLIQPSSNGAVITPKAEEFIKEFRDILHGIIEKLRELEDTLNAPL
jgi:predicted transcriptional regulator